MESVPKRRRPCFLDRNDGLASLAEMETVLTANHQHNHNPLISWPLYLQRRSCLKDISSISSPRLANGRRFYETRFDTPQPHFLEACFLCKKTLGDNTDIFMYRGDTPFCSEECRQEQIEMDEAKEKRLNLSASVKALRKKDKKKSTSSNETAQDYPLHRGTVAAA